MIYLQLLWVYLKIGLFGFGGGYAMLSLVQDEIVTQQGWLTMQQFTDIVALSQVTPGPIGINSATYVGYTVTGSIWGAIIATFAVSLPSFLLVLLISVFFHRFRTNRWVDAAFSGLRPATVGLIASAALLLSLYPSAILGWMQGTGTSSILVAENFPDLKSLGLFVLCLFVAFKRWVHPILLIFLAGIAGLILYL